MVASGVLGRFAESLRRIAEDTGENRLIPVIRRLDAPIRVAVRGRDGVGRRTVAAALTGAGLAVTRSAADLTVVVTVETLKPEDRAVLDGLDGPALVILNKADLTGFGADGPMALAQRRAADCRAMTGVPTVPMVALLADVVLDDELTGALRTLMHATADLSSADAFVACPHPLSAQVRARLIATLDRFGIAHAVLALGDGVDALALPGHLRQHSQLDRVVEYLHAATAPLRYRRMSTAMIQLRSLATQSAQVADFLRADATVLAAMTAAVDVIEAAGARVDRAGSAAAHRRRAVHWQRYARGPVSPLHRACAADIARGSLRLLEQTR